MFRSPAVHALALLLLAAPSASAQNRVEVEANSENRPQGEPGPGPRWQFIVSSGAIVPTGAQRDAIGRGKLTTAQLAYFLSQGVAVTASFGWTRTRDIASADDPKLDMFTYDAGVELRANRWLDGGTLSFSPFAGAGAGGRSYNYRSLDADATHNLAGYVSAGGEVGLGSRARVRLEARDYLTGFKPLTGGGSSRARNDLALMAGLRLRVR